MLTLALIARHFTAKSLAKIVGRQFWDRHSKDLSRRLEIIHLRVNVNFHSLLGI